MKRRRRAATRGPWAFKSIPFFTPTGPPEVLPLSYPPRFGFAPIPFLTVALVASFAQAQTTSSSPAATPTAAPAAPVDPAPPVPAGETPRYTPGPGTPFLSLPPTKIGGLTVSGQPGRGFTIETDDGRYSLNLQGRFQLRDTLNDAEGEQAGKEKDVWTNQLNIKTVRLILDGHLLSPHIDYFIQFAFGGTDDAGATSQSASPIYDAFLDFTYLRDLNLRAGQFFVPFDRARTIRESALQLVDRQQVVNELSLNRDVGLKLFSDNLFGLNGVLGYALGVFNGGGINNFNGKALGLLYTGRVVIKPFGSFDDDIEGDLNRLSSPRLAIGGAVAYNQHTVLAQSTFGNVLTLGSVNYLNADADLVFKTHGFSFLAEYLYRQSELGPGEFSQTTKPSGSEVSTTINQWARNGQGYLVQAGYMFTDFFEVVGRFDQLFATGNTDPTLVKLAQTQGREGGGGFNFYLNHHQLKIQADYFNYWGPTNVPDSGRNQVRLQLDVSI